MTRVAELQVELDALRAEIAVAEAEERAARIALRDEANSRKIAAAVDADDEEFFGGVNGSDRAVLPFGRDYGKWNPLDVENAAFGKSWLGSMTSLICRRLDESRTRPTRLVFTSSPGIPWDGDKIGAQFTARHDQTGARLGFYEIVGLVIYDTEGNVARVVGDVPNIKFSQSTYK